MGTPEFAVPSLEALHAAYGVKAVVTVPDKPKGRGLKLLPSAVKAKAVELGIPVLQPEKLKDIQFINSLKELKPDIIVVIAFRILPEEVYSLASTGTFNIHGSLLPKYRGAAPINRAIINGDEVSGLTSFLLKKEVDTGDILLKKQVRIPDNATAGDLHDMLMPVAAQLSVETIELLLSGSYTPCVQDNSLASPAPKIFPDQCRIDWTGEAATLKNFIHGMSPSPGAWTMWNGKRLKILRVELLKADGKGNPGSFRMENGLFTVDCAFGKLSIVELQAEGKKAMKTHDFLAGYRGEATGTFESGA